MIMKKVYSAFISLALSIFLVVSLAIPALAASVTIPKKITANGKDLLSFTYNSSSKTLTAKEAKIDEDEGSFMENEELVILATMNSGDIQTQNVIMTTYLESGGESDYAMALGLALSEPVRSGKVNKFVLDEKADPNGTVYSYTFKKDEFGNISEIDFDEGDGFKYVGQIGYDGALVKSATFVASFGRTDTYLYKYDTTTHYLTEMQHINTTDTRSADSETIVLTLDKLGRSTKDDSREFTYNDQNQLIKSVWPGYYPEDDDGDQVINLKYDDEGNLVNLSCPKDKMSLNFSYTVI